MTRMTRITRITRMGRGNGIRGIREIRGYILDGAPVSVLRLGSRCAEEIRSSNLGTRKPENGQRRKPKPAERLQSRLFQQMDTQEAKDARRKTG